LFAFDVSFCSTKPTKWMRKMTGEKWGVKTLT